MTNCQKYKFDDSTPVQKSIVTAVPITVTSGKAGCDGSARGAAYVVDIQGEAGDAQGKGLGHDYR